MTATISDDGKSLFGSINNYSSNANIAHNLVSSKCWSSRNNKVAYMRNVGSASGRSYYAKTAGGAWRMPTKEEFELLFSNTHNSSMAIDDGVSTFRSKKTGYENCFIFFPLAGYGYEKYYCYGYEESAIYYSSSIYEENKQKAWSLNLIFSPSNIFYWEVSTRPFRRFYAGSIRPVFTLQ